MATKISVNNLIQLIGSNSYKLHKRITQNYPHIPFIKKNIGITFVTYTNGGIKGEYLNLRKLYKLLQQTSKCYVVCFNDGYIGECVYIFPTKNSIPQYLKTQPLYIVNK